MKIKAFIIFPLLAIALGLTDLSIVHNVQFLFIRQILVFTTFAVLPGLLINLILRVRNVSKLEYLLYSIGGSIAFSMLCGLFINWLLPLRHIPNPLSFNNIFATFNISTLVLLIVAYARNIHISTTIKKPKIRLSNILLYTIPVLLPLLSIFGALMLNNGNTSLLSIVMLGLTALYLLFITFYVKKTENTLFPFVLFLVSLAVLLMMSLRSWYIAGFDISMEYEVFKITQEKMLWAMVNFKNEYNTCLSITILPTYLSSLLQVNDIYIYKFFFQAIFAFTPVGIYYLVKKLGQNNIIAFLSGLFYLCNPWFIDPMTTLNRQEMAFFFFILVLLLLFEKGLSTLKKYSLLALLTTGLVVSHYSSTYITIIIFSLVYITGICINVFNFLRKILFKQKLNYISINIKLLFLVFLILITYLWYSAFNASTNNLKDVANNTLKNLPHIFSQNTKTTIIDQIFNLGKQTVVKNVYQDYYNTKTAEYKSNRNLYPYDPSKYSNYSVTPKQSQSLKISNKTVFSAADYLYKFLLIFIEISLISGTIYLFFLLRRKAIDANFIIYLLICELLLLAMIIVPYISVGYNFDRLYMQVMFVLSFVEIVGGIAIIKLLFKNPEIQMKILSILYILVFLYTYSFVWQFVGGKTAMWLNNFGYYYDQSYTHTSDFFAAEWMKKIPNNPLIDATSLGKNILIAYGDKINIRGDIFPSTIEKHAYVFVTEINYKENLSSFFYRGNHFEYEYPFDFLNQNKDLIYNNGGAEVYK